LHLETKLKRMPHDLIDPPPEIASNRVRRCGARVRIKPHLQPHAIGPRIADSVEMRLFDSVIPVAFITLLKRVPLIVLASHREGRCRQPRRPVATTGRQPGDARDHLSAIHGVTLTPHPLAGEVRAERGEGVSPPITARCPSVIALARVDSSPASGRAVCELSQSPLTPPPMFDKILLANRGEVAVRIIRTARRLGIKTAIVYSEADRDSLAVEMADEAVFIGPPPAALSYLVIDKIVAAAKQTGSQAIHPGFGYLSEKAEFADRLEAEKIVFIGPNAHAIR